MPAMTDDYRHRQGKAPALAFRQPDGRRNWSSRRLSEGSRRPDQPEQQRTHRRPILTGGSGHQGRRHEAAWASFTLTTHAGQAFKIGHVNQKAKTMTENTGHNLPAARRDLRPQPCLECEARRVELLPGLPAGYLIIARSSIFEQRRHGAR